MRHPKPCRPAKLWCSTTSVWPRPAPTSPRQGPIRRSTGRSGASRGRPGDRRAGSHGRPADRRKEQAPSRHRSATANQPLPPGPRHKPPMHGTTRSPVTQTTPASPSPAGSSFSSPEQPLADGHDAWLGPIDPRWTTVTGNSQSSQPARLLTTRHLSVRAHHCRVRTRCAGGHGEPGAPLLNVRGELRRPRDLEPGAPRCSVPGPASSFSRQARQVLLPASPGGPGPPPT